MKRALDLLILLSLVVLFLSSCAEVSVEMPADGSAGSSAATTHSRANTTTPLLPSVNLNFQAVAGGIHAETVDAMPPDADAAWFDMFPQHIRLTLQDYVVQNSQLQPRIFIYPLKELAAYPEPAKVADGLRGLLANKQIEPQLPCLPYFADRQVLHPQLQFMDFKSGHGVRYLTQFSQAAIPVINNHDLVYVYQGLTADGRYYVSAVLPINRPGLPITDTASPEIANHATADYAAYLAGVSNELGNASPASFTPNINELDAMLQSLEIK